MFGNKGIISLMLVLLLLVISPGLASCAKEGAGGLPCKISLNYVDAVFIGSYADPALLTKESKANIVEIGLTVSNPSDVMVTVDNLVPELRVDGIFWGASGLPGKVYIPPGKEVTLKFAFTPLTFPLVQGVMLGEGKTVPDSAKRVLGMLAALSKGEAKCNITGTLGFSTKVGSYNQPFSFAWPTEK